MAPGARHQWMDHPDRKPRCTAGLRQMRVSTALYGLYVCHFAVYSDCASVSFRKEDVLILLRCTGRLVRAAFFGLYLSFERFPFVNLVLNQPPVPITAVVKCEDKSFLLQLDRSQNKICQSRLCSSGRFSVCLRQLCSSLGNASPAPSAFRSCRGSRIYHLSIKTTAKRSTQVLSCAPGLLRGVPTSSERSCARSG